VDTGFGYVAFNINFAQELYAQPVYMGEPGSSVGLDDRAIEVRSPAETRGIFL
jgi:hypothetical protein